MQSVDVCHATQDCSADLSEDRCFYFPSSSPEIFVSLRPEAGKMKTNPAEGSLL